MDENVHTTLSDGMQGELRKAATDFEFDEDVVEDKNKTSFFGVVPDEVDKEDFAFRPDVSFKQGMTYEPKIVKFLAQYITEAGIIIKRSLSGNSAKAQMKVAREIKTS